jgi:hypothetical protein
MATHVKLDPELQGDTWQWLITITPEDVGDTLPDLTVSTVTATITDQSGTAMWTGSTATSGVTVTDAVAGVVQVIVPPADTADFADGFYNGDIQVRVNAGGETRTPVTFRLPVKEDYSS